MGSTVIAFIAVVIISNQSAVGIPMRHPSQLLNYAPIAGLLIGLGSDKARVHAVLAVAVSSLLVAYFFTFLGQPDSVFRVSP